MNYWKFVAFSRWLCAPGLTAFCVWAALWFRCWRALAKSVIFNPPILLSWPGVFFLSTCEVILPIVDRFNYFCYVAIGPRFFAEFYSVSPPADSGVGGMTVGYGKLKAPSYVNDTLVCYRWWDPFICYCYYFIWFCLLTSLIIYLTLFPSAGFAGVVTVLVWLESALFFYEFLPCFGISWARVYFLKELEFPMSGGLPFCNSSSND